MKRFDESVPRQLGEILIKHGRPPLTDPKLCENLLKDYCPEFKEEISLLVLGVKERIASDLLVSQDGLQRDLLRALLVKRLRKAHQLSEGDARWIVEAWATATRTLARKGSVTSHPSPIPDSSPSKPWPKSGIIGRCAKAVRSLAVSSLNETIVSGSDDGSIQLWTPETSTLLKQCDAPVAALAFSPNGVLIASASRAIELVDIQSGEVTLLGQAGKQPSLIFSPGGKSLAAACTDSPCEIRVWNLQTGQVRVLKGDWKGPASISFSPDGRTITAADDRSIRLWDLETGTARILGHANRQITSVAFLSDGKRVASGSWDETVRLWNVVTGEARILGENCSCVTHLAVSNSGDRIAASSLDGRIRVWDVATGRSRNAGECYGVNAISFTNDDHAVVTGSDDGSVRLWNTAH